MQRFSDSEIHEVEVLKGLGLTKNQARIYLALAKLGISTAKQISKSSRVTREEVYRICPKLFELGLIEKIITSPIRFKATPIEDGITFLVQRQTREINDRHGKAKKLAIKFHKKKAEAIFQNNRSEFALIPKGPTLTNRIKKTIDSAQKSVSIITSVKRHLSAIYLYNEVVNRALSRGVKFRVIAWKLEEEEIPNIAKKFSRHFLVSVRYISSPPKAVVVLVDNNKGFLMKSPTSELEGSSALQFENLSLARLLREYFGYVWSTATRENQVN